MRPSRRAREIACTAAPVRPWWWTAVRTPFAAAFSSTASACSRSTQIGFSTSMCTPCSSTRMQRS